MAKGDDVYGKEYAKEPSFLQRMASMGNDPELSQIGYQNPTGFGNPQAPPSPIAPSSNFQQPIPFQMGSDPSGMSGIGPEKPQGAWDKLKAIGERLRQEQVRQMLMEQMKNRRPGDI